MNPILIIGAGMAGYGVLREFRKRDADTPVTLITADDGRVYSKPNLSNALAQKRSPAQLAAMDAAKAADTYRARILTETRVTAIDPAGHAVSTDGGDLAYGRLVLALGADPFSHGLAGEAADDVFTVNDLTDYALFRAALEGKRRVVILGGGLIGCEFANDLLLGGHEVSVVHLGGWPLERLVPEPAGRALADALAARGVDWHFGRTGRTVERAGEGYVLTLDDGSRVRADLILSAIGLRPRTGLARAAGIETDRGIVVDRGLCTSTEDVYAVGDCAQLEGLVLPYVQPLLIQARALAATLAGEPTPLAYPAMPVVVKTSLHPVAVQPPPMGAAGHWRVEGDGEGIRALFLAPDGGLLGFALTGRHTGERARLAEQVPPMLA